MCWENPVKTTYIGLDMNWQVPIVAPQWQLCPKCNGHGKAPNYDLANHIPCDLDTCDLCNGKKIISIHNGKPPE